MTDLMTPCVAFSESSKLSDRILNIELLRHLARLQSDPETSTPTRIFVLKDRVVWVMAFITTAACFEMDDIAAGEEYVDDVFVGGYEDKDQTVGAAWIYSPEATGR
ncbi:hypothetical protein EV424DRAFT_1603591 [Suillus variegatus]|nr:hypothetical protein EV424DRAFT_1603591 [Suillus variegatus]